MGNLFTLLASGAVFGLVAFVIVFVIEYRNDEHWARRLVQLYRNLTDQSCRKGIHDMERDDYLFYEFDEDVWYCKKCGHCEVRSLDVRKQSASALEVNHG